MQMELVSLAMLVGSVSCSTLINAKADQIVDVIDDILRSVAPARDRLGLDRPSLRDEAERADLSLD